jgi:hypothetical protein
MLKTLTHGNGCFAGFWHTMLIPVPCSVEVPLHLGLLFMVLKWRVHPTAAMLDGASGGPSAVLQRLFSQASRSSCNLVASMHGGGYPPMCQLAGPHAPVQLAFTSTLYTAYVLPLYIR